MALDAAAAQRSQGISVLEVRVLNGERKTRWQLASGKPWWHEPEKRDIDARPPLAAVAGRGHPCAAE